MAAMDSTTSSSSIPVLSSTTTDDTIRIQVLFFASAREAAGNISSTELELPQGCNTLQLRYDALSTDVFSLFCF
jgi:hypothetical protein